jgi:dienelactone hydrolase
MEKPMISEEIDYKAGTTALKGFLASPGGAERKPGLLIAHEAPGLSQHTRDIAVRAAETGYVAFAVDYLGAGRMLTEMQAVMEQVSAWVSDPSGLRQCMKAAHDVLLARSDVDPARIGGLGYCFGGQALIEYARTGADLAAIVGFHSGMSVNRPAESRAIRPRILMCLRANDPITKQSERIAFEQEMNSAGVDWRMIVYGKVGHSFTNPAVDALGIAGVAYDRIADQASWRAMLDFLRECGHRG